MIPGDWMQEYMGLTRVKRHGRVEDAQDGGETEELRKRIVHTGSDMQGLRRGWLGIWRLWRHMGMARSKWGEDSRKTGFVIRQVVISRFFISRFGGV